MLFTARKQAEFEAGYGLRFALSVCTLALSMQTFSAPAQPTHADTLSRAEVGAVCARPYAPYPGHYASAVEFNAARETYYKEASIYVSECIDRWVSETRKHYEDMFLIEAVTYRQDRHAVMDEMRDAAHLQY